MTATRLRKSRATTRSCHNSLSLLDSLHVDVAWSHMHVPLVHGLAFAGKSGIGPLGDSLMEVDTAAGQILAALDRTGAASDTLVFLTGDNGPPEDQCDWGGSKGPFLGSAAKTVAGGGGSAGKLTSCELVALQSRQDI